MIKYNLEEFKEWLEENPNIKAKVPRWFYNLVTSDVHFQHLIEKRDHNSYRFSDVEGNWGQWKTYQEVIHGWIKEIDNREREREREREQNEEERITMPICKQCHQEKSVIVEETGICSSCEYYNTNLKAKNELLEQENKELKTENRTHLQSLWDAQDWREIQAEDIKALQKQTKALTLLANSRKAQLEQEKQALIKLANKKLTNQREAKQLLKELTEKWDKEKAELEQNNTNLNQEITLTKATLQNAFQSLKDLQQSKENQTQRILALEADKSELIKAFQEQKDKHNNYLTKEKSLLIKEIKLIKEALHE